jgi:hypothetical protein
MASNEPANIDDVIGVSPGGNQAGAGAPLPPYIVESLEPRERASGDGADDIDDVVPAPSQAGGAGEGQASPFQREPLDQRQETTRGLLGRALLLLLTGIVAAVFTFVGIGVIPPRYLVETIFPSVVTLVGTALGFYFGSRTAGGGGGIT